MATSGRKRYIRWEKDAPQPYETSAGRENPERSPQEEREPLLDFDAEDISAVSVHCSTPCFER